MKKLIFTLIIMVLVFPFSVSAKTILIKAEVPTNLKDININKVIVSLVMDSEPEGTIEYDVHKGDAYKKKITNFPDDAPVEFAYGAVVYNNKVDSVGRFIVKCKELTETNGIYNVVITVEDSKNPTTTTQVVIEEKKEKKNYNKYIAYAIIAFVVLVIIIFALLFLIRALRASAMY